MSTTTTATRLDHNAVKVSSVSDGPAGTTLYWYVDGRLVSAEAYPRERVFTLSAGQSALIEVLDTTDAPQDAFSGHVVFQWTAVALASKYLVQEWDGAEWQTKRTILSRGVELFDHLTDWLDDGVAYQYRVLPISEENIEGTPLEFSFTVVRRPDAPDTTVIYDPDTQRVTVAAA